MELLNENGLFQIDGKTFEKLSDVLAYVGEGDATFEGERFIVNGNLVNIRNFAVKKYEDAYVVYVGNTTWNPFELTTLKSVIDAVIVLTNALVI